MADIKRGLDATLCGWDGGSGQGGLQDGREAGRRPAGAPAPVAAEGAGYQSGSPMSFIVALARAVEIEIIPRLLQARHDSEVKEKLKLLDKPTMPEEVVEFVELVLANDEAGIMTQIERMRADGASVESLYLDLFTGAARRLGEFWTADRCDFVQVTLAVMLLQRLVQELGPAFQQEQRPAQVDHSSLLLPMPGEQHNFGLSIVSQFFRRDGWDVFSDALASSVELVEMVRQREFDLVGLSASCEVQLDALASRIAMVRRSSRNKGLLVMVGGSLFNDRPALVARVGADFSAPDAREAVRTADRMLARRTTRAAVR